MATNSHDLCEEVANRSALETTAQAVCLVSYGQSRKVVLLTGGRKQADLRASLLGNHFALLAGRCFLIQIYNERFQCFVDLDDDTEIEDGAKINLLVCDDTDRPIAEKQPNTGLQDLNLMGSTQGSPKEADEYVLPQVPVDIAVEVKTVRKGDVPDRLRRNFVDWIFYDLSSRGMYPKRIYTAAARSLVASYPQLKDSSDDGYFSWLLSLKNKFKNVRKRMPPGCPEVDAQKAKVRVRKLVDGGDQQNKVPFRREMDPVFVSETINFMKKELSGPNPSMEKIKDAMDRTTQSRRKCLEVDSMNMQDFLKLYPALTVEKEILNECSRLTSISPDESLLQALRQHADGILEAVQHKQPALPTYTSVTTAIKMAQGISKSYAIGVGALILLPFLLSERGDDIFAPLVDGRTRPYPTIIFTGDSVMFSEGLNVTFENVQIDVLDVTAGMSLLFSMYWAYNIEYVQSAKQTFALLEHLMGIKRTKLSTRAIKVLTKLNARAAERQQ